MHSNDFLVQLLEVFFGTMGIGFIVLGVARGLHDSQKLLFILPGLALAGYIYWRQRKRRQQ